MDYLSGPAMKQVLTGEVGLQHITHLTRKRDGTYFMEINHCQPDGHIGTVSIVPPPEVYVRALKSTFAGVKVVSTSEAVTTWRPDNPVRFGGSVSFRLEAGSRRRGLVDVIDGEAMERQARRYRRRKGDPYPTAGYTSANRYLPKSAKALAFPAPRAIVLVQ